MASQVQDVTPVGSLFVNVNMAQNTVNQLIAPSTNLYGAIVRTFHLNLIVPSGTGLAIAYADTTAPSTVFDGTRRVITQFYLQSTAATQVWPGQLYLPPGVGMWAGGNQVGQSAHLTYDLLPMDDPDPPLPGSSILPGSVMSYAGAVAPPNWLLCDGSAVSRSTYSALFAILGTTFGSGDGSTTFGLPDLRGRAVFGKDNMGGTAANRVTAFSGITGTTLGAAGGDQRMQSHTHNIVTQIAGSGGAQGGTPTGQGGGLSGSLNPLTNTTEGSGSSQNMPPALILNYIIKT